MRCEITTALWPYICAAVRPSSLGKSATFFAFLRLPGYSVELEEESVLTLLQPQPMIATQTMKQVGNIYYCLVGILFYDLFFTVIIYSKIYK